ncbi:unnamed protein product [Euphydryas editha]|uniref:Mos1 transposase HTH domain-containing protein n=1 Tax=Euphydryas editha TaxID=104508 RepID=A0AAU9U631_EUPED|nr:unnamed protein product [Euphydryas editha]
MEKMEYRAVIKFLEKEGKTPAEIKQQRLDAVYGHFSPSYSTVKEWVKQFRLGRQSIEDDPRQDVHLRPLLMKTLILWRRQLWKTERQLKTKELVAITGLSKTAVLRILHELDMNK